MDDGKRSKLVHQLRELLIIKSKDGADCYSLEKNKLDSDQFLARYLRFTQGNVEQAQDLLRDYVKLNKELDLDSILAKRLVDYPPEIRNLYTFQFGGRDLDGRPVTTVTDASADIHRFLKNFGSDEKMLQLYFEFMFKQHMTIEKLVVDRNVDHGVTIIDVSRVNYSQYLNKKTVDFILENAKRLERHAPGIVGKVIVVNAPAIAKPIVKMIAKFIGFSAEIVIFSTRDNWREELRKFVPENGVCPHFGGTLTEFGDF